MTMLEFKIVKDKQNLKPKDMLGRTSKVMSVFLKNS